MGGAEVGSISQSIGIESGSFHVRPWGGGGGGERRRRETETEREREVLIRYGKIILGVPHPSGCNRAAGADAGCSSACAQTEI